MWSFRVGDIVIYKNKEGYERLGKVSGYDESMVVCPMIIEGLEVNEVLHFTPDGRKTLRDIEPSVILYKRV